MSVWDRMCGGGGGWTLYMVRSADSRLYTGITTDPGRRIEEHRRGGRRGAKALRGRAPLNLVFSCSFADRSTALTAEYRVKQLSRSMKERLIAGEFTLQSLIADDESKNGS